MSADVWVAEHYDLHGAEIHGLAFRLLGDRQLAEEVTQDTFLKAWRARDTFDGTRASARTWLFSIARNTVIDVARARKIRFQVGSDPDRVTRQASDATGGPSQIDSLISRHWLEEALRHLPEEIRIPIVEVHVKGRPLADVGDEMGIPTGTVKSRLHRGLKELRRTLGEVTP